MAEQPPLGEVFLAACAEHAGRRAVVDADQELSYGQLAERVKDRARTLVDLLGPDEHRIALYAANSADYLVSYYALLIAGRLPFLVDSQFGASELQGIRDSCGVDTFLTDKAEHFPLPPASCRCPAAATSWRGRQVPAPASRRTSPGGPPPPAGSPRGPPVPPSAWSSRTRPCTARH